MLFNYKALTIAVAGLSLTSAAPTSDNLQKRGVGTVHVVNQCSFDVWNQLVPANLPNVWVDPPDLTIFRAGQTISVPINSPPHIDLGASWKISCDFCANFDKSCRPTWSHAQLEWSWGKPDYPGKIAYDFSSVNGEPFKDFGVMLHVTQEYPEVGFDRCLNSGCAPGKSFMECIDVYTWPGDFRGEHSCPEWEDLTLILCSG